MAGSSNGDGASERISGRTSDPGGAGRWGGAARLAAVAGAALLTANCAGSPPPGMTAKAGRQVDPKYGVAPSPRLYGENDPIPKGGGRAMVGKPYVVAGHTYVPRENPRGYVREGLASWYGTAFHGRLTANGEVFDRFSVAAAHPTLPLPSYARVTNIANGHSMVVRVNDRGPYHAGRLMDVSQSVAEALDFRRQGTTRVRVEYVGKASVAGSDDRKLMATLRTDGRPAGTRSIMLAEAGEETRPQALAETRPLALRRPEPLPEPVPSVVERPRPAPVRIAEAPRAAPLRLAEMPRPAPAAPQRLAAPAPAPVAGPKDRNGLAQAMLAASVAKAPAGSAAARHAGPLPLSAPLRLTGAPPHPAGRGQTAIVERAPERMPAGPRAKVAGML
ncbi:septal ring lytic transglycosylase RlpA family protein [Methylobacterium oryzisoli]|uniref:septal ring lytic transglycosylase RlpA family protein n=1 Tax=Methylobacterium oryzisoli TaxID=3385502 RepID=UPI003892B620